MLHPARAKIGMTSLRKPTGGVTAESATLTGTSTVLPSYVTFRAVTPSASGWKVTPPSAATLAFTKRSSAGANLASAVTSRVEPSDSVSTAIRLCRSRAVVRSTVGG